MVSPQEPSTDTDAAATVSGGAVVLGDGVVTLRGLSEDDVPGVLEFALDPESSRFVPLPQPYGDGDAREFVAAARAGWARAATAVTARRDWAIDVQGRYCGSIDARITYGRVAEIGFGVHPRHRGQGLCARAARLVVDHLFDDLDVEAVRWRADADNLASWRVVWSLGFRLEGISRGTLVTGADRDRPPSDERTATLQAGQPRRPYRPWYEAVPLGADQVRLREWRPGDATDHPDTATDCDPQRRRREQVLRMSGGDGVFWCITDAQDQAVGTIDLSGFDDDSRCATAALSFRLDPAARGRGLVQEAIDLVLAHAFAPRTDDAGRTGLGLHRITADTDATDRAAQRTLRRAGSREIGRRRDAPTRVQGPPADTYAFELLAGDDRVAQTIEPAVISPLRTRRLVLRPWRADDVPPPEHELDRDSLRFMPVGAQPTTDTFGRWFERRQRQVDLGSHHWCITRAADDEPLGTISLWDSAGEPALRSREIGYWIYAAHRRNGYLREAIEAVVRHAFTDPVRHGLGLNRLHAGTDAENVASHAILREAGFTQWGHDHQAYLRPDGSLSDGRYFELLSSQR